MTLIGVGVLIIGIALLILSVFLAYTLYNLGTVLGSVNKTVEQLPDQLDGILEETGDAAFLCRWRCRQCDKSIFCIH